VDSRRPTFTFTNSTSVNGVAIGDVVYRVQLLLEDGSLSGEAVIPQGAGTTTSGQPGGDLPFDTNFGWRVRAEMVGGSAWGPWSNVALFRSSDSPRAAAVAGSGSPRTISLGEAVAIIQGIYNDMRWNLGSRSSREQRNLYLEAAVAALHYGHPRFNPGGPDSLWCIKNGGPGRPQADDVIIRCDTGEAWDLVVSIGADHYHWHTDYIGRLGPPQQIYPPSPNALGILPR
jgi:hypothetical protein